MFKRLSYYLIEKLKGGLFKANYLVTLLICFCLSFGVNAHVSFPSELKAVGQAELKVLWFDIYKAKLMTLDGRYNGINQSIMLMLDYQRKISAKELLKETETQLAKFSKRTEIITWLHRLEYFWVSVKEGDQLAFYIDRDKTGHFFFNREWVGVVRDPHFSQAFIKIWLSENSRYPRLAKQLRGD